MSQRVHSYRMHTDAFNMAALPLRPSPVCYCFYSWLALTDPRDVARIESKTVIITREQRDTVPIPKSGISQLGRWMSEGDFEKAFNARFPGCMKGRRSTYLRGKISASLLL